MEKKEVKSIYKQVKIKYEQLTNGQYGKVIEIQSLEPYAELFLNALYENQYNVKFKFELIMMPSWTSKAKHYQVGNDIFTHIRLKRGFFMEYEKGAEK